MDVILAAHLSKSVQHGVLCAILLELHGVPYNFIKINNNGLASAWLVLGYVSTSYDMLCKDNACVTGLQWKCISNNGIGMIQLLILPVVE